MKKYLLILMVSSLLLACGNDTEIVETEDDTEAVDEILPERAAKAQLVFQTVPSPLETVSLFFNAGANYNADLLNPIENVNTYATNHLKALNFGVYGADLSYANIFDQTQESMFYMNCCKKLSDALGVTSAFDAETMERLEENINNRDSLMILINDAFWIADAFLKENEQDHLSALIIAGGWIEGLYIGAKVLNRDHPDEGLMKKIADQKFSLDNLLELLSTYDNEEVKNIKAELQKLAAIYDKVEEVEGEITVDNSNSSPTIVGGSTVTYEQDAIFEIVDEIEKIRNEIIQ